MVDRNLTTLEAVALAVRSEIESTELYEDLAQRVKNPAARKALMELAADEEKHREGLMKMYREMLQGESPSIPETDGRKKALKVEDLADRTGVIAAARDKERDSEAFYRKAAGAVQDFKTRRFFLDVADSERRHALALEKMLSQLQKDPRWLDREEADPHRGTHLGP